MTALEHTGCTGTLSIDGVLLNGPAWDLPDLTALWFEFDVRGDDRLLPGSDGVLPYRRRVTVTQHALPMIVTGAVDRFGEPYADAWVGMETNVAYLLTNVVLPTNVGDGTRSATLTLPSGATRTANVHVLRLAKGLVLGGRLRATLDLSIPNGRFT